MLHQPIDLVPDGQITEFPVQPHSRKYSCSPFTQITSYQSPSRSLQRGAARDRHGRWERDAVDAMGASDEGAWSRTVKSCGSDAPTLASSGDNACALRLRRWQESPVTGKSAKETVKPLRRECRVISAEPVVSNSCAFYFCTRGRGCGQHPAFPAPSDFPGRRIHPRPGRETRRGKADVHPTVLATYDIRIRYIMEYL